VDPLSVLIGIPVLGPVLAWALMEIRDMRKRLEALIEKNAQANQELAVSIQRRADSDHHLAASIDRLSDSLTVRETRREIERQHKEST
jgi:septal ring factor EnvC (AmiA/AmiB activator)